MKELRIPRDFMCAPSVASDLSAHTLRGGHSQAVEIPSE